MKFGTCISGQAKVFFNGQYIGEITGDSTEVERRGQERLYLGDDAYERLLGILIGRAFCRPTHIEVINNPPDDHCVYCDDALAMDATDQAFIEEEDANWWKRGRKNPCDSE